MAALSVATDRAAAREAGTAGPASARSAGPVAADRSGAGVQPDRAVRSWPLLVLAAPAAAEVWSGWVGIAQKTGFGLVRPLPGIWPSLHLDTAITLPIGVEAYAAYALRAWLARDRTISGRTRRFAKWSAICSFALGMAGQVAYHCSAHGRSPKARTLGPGARGNLMRSLKTLIAAATITTLGIGVPAVLASTASAAVTPVIYNYASGWHNAAVRPHWIVIGQGGSPMAHTWWWNTWNSTVAKSTGTLWVDNCIPNCALGKESYHHLYVTLSGVKHHNGRAYYSKMTWYTPGYRTFGSHGSTLALHVNSGGFWS